jgi:hypothetical protein
MKKSKYCGKKMTTPESTFTMPNTVESNATSASPLSSPDVPTALCVVMVNGLHGFPSDYDNFEIGLDLQFKELITDHRHSLFMLKSQASQGVGTHDGLEIMGDRLAKEVVAWFEETVIPALDGVR